MRNNFLADEPKTSRIIYACTGLLIAAVWLVVWGKSSSCSLWLDETITYAVISGDFFDSITRSYVFLGQSPLYYALLWLVKEFISSSEIALRVPSLIFVVLTAWFLMRVTAKLFNKTAAVGAVIVFLTEPHLLDIFTDARPYSIAMFFSLASCSTLISMLEERTERSQVLYILSSALVIYSHYMYSTVFVLHLLYVLLKYLRDLGTVKTLMLRSWLLIFLLVLPLGGQVLILVLTGTHKSLGVIPPAGYFFNTAVSSPWLFRLIVPCFLVFLVYAWISGNKELIKSEFNRNWTELVFLLGWIFLPPLLLFDASHVLGVSVYLDRYYAWNTLGYSILSGWILGKFEPRFFRGATILVLTSLFILALGLGEWGGVTKRCTEDWREAVEFIHKSANGEKPPLFVYPRHIECKYNDWLTEPAKKDIMLSVLQYYSYNAPTALLPLDVDQPENAPEYMRQAVLSLVTAETKKVFLLLRFPNRRIEKFIEKELSLKGFRKKKRRRFKVTVVSVFVRDNENKQ